MTYQKLWLWTAHIAECYPNLFWLDWDVISNKFKMRHRKDVKKFAESLK